MGPKLNKNIDFKIKFWGVRGSKPTPGRKTLLFGGNTACVQVEGFGQNIIFDSGTGIVELGKSMMEEDKQAGHIFFSHLHWDHIQGLPFFEPMFKEGNTFFLYGQDKEGLTFKEIIEKQMAPPYYPITMATMKADRKFFSIGPNQDIDLGQDIRVKTFAVNHFGGCLAYRLEGGTSSIVYCTDTEHMEGEERLRFLNFIRGADILIYDAHFTDEEYYGSLDGKSKEGWGHSTWEEGVKICREAKIAYLILYHHRDTRTDREQEQIEILAQEEFKNTIAAREGMIITIGGGSTEKVVINYPY